MTSAAPALPVPPADLVKHLAKQPDESLVELIAPYRKYEAYLRETFAQNRDSELLKDPHVNVLPLFTDDTPDIKIRARDLESESDEEKARYIMSLPDDIRRPHGSPAVVSDLKEFRRNFNVFSESALVELDWSNVVAAGSSVVNCLLPVPEQYSGTKRGLREFYHEKFCPASDVDLFIYGLTEEQAIEKIKDIEAKVRDVLLVETTTVRTKHAVTICSQHPNRHIQIVLRIYNSISEILTGFDIDSSGAAYDGKQVYCTPRALQSYMTQINHIDLTRRSPSYENRLSKYSHRGFEVYWPDLDRTRVDPTIFERSFQRTLGLARLLVLERLPTSTVRDSYLDTRRRERGRPEIDRYNRFWRSNTGNIKDQYEDEIADWVNEEEVSNYHTFTIPYGQKFHAKKIEKLCYTRDLLLNAEWNQSDDREVYLHRHPAFFGRFEDVIQDCCGYCPVPQTDEEKEIAEKEAKIYVSGKISFIKDDPGRQQIGSFNPLTDDDWTEMAYVGNTARLCIDIVDGDAEQVSNWLAQEGANPDTRDFTGRAPIHLAAMTSTPEVVKLLVDAGARLTARLADGRTALHLAAARGHVEIVKILMDKSLANEEEYEEKQDQRRKAKSSEQESQKPNDDPVKDTEECDDDPDAEIVDDGESDTDLIDDDESVEAKTMATGSFVDIKKATAEEPRDEIVPEDEDQPNFYDINALAWDTPCSPLHLAIVSGHEDVVKTLCQEYGADILMPVKFLDREKKPSGSLLTLVLSLALPVEKAMSMTKLILSLGATCAQGDVKGITAFQSYVEKDSLPLVETLLETDPTGSKTAIKHVAVPDWNHTQTSLDVAIRAGNVDMVSKLLDHGASVEIDFDTWIKGANKTIFSSYPRSLEENEKTFRQNVPQPLVLALNSINPETALLLLDRGADPNVLTQEAYRYIHATYRYDSRAESALDVVRQKLKVLREYKGEAVSAVKPVLPVGIDTYLERFEAGSYQHWVVSNDIETKKTEVRRGQRKFKRDLSKAMDSTGKAEKMEAIQEIIATLEKIERTMLDKGAKRFEELQPDYRSTPDGDTYNTSFGLNRRATTALIAEKDAYEYNFVFQLANDLTTARRDAYVKLFDAAWAGDLDKIKTFTLGAWDDAQEEAPLKIAVTDLGGNNPFSLAVIRGHFDVAAAILEIAQAQYSPEEASKVRFRMQDEDESGDESYDSECDSDCHSDDSDRPKIRKDAVGGDFTVDNIGQVSMKVNSRTKPLTLLGWNCRGFGSDGRPRAYIEPLFSYVVDKNDVKGLKALLDMAEHHSAKKLDLDDEPSAFYAFPDNAFSKAVTLGRFECLIEIIKRTGAGLPLERLVQGSGIELKEKPRFYQGLTVYGKKRKDWATAGREVVRRATGLEASPVLIAAKAGCLETTEWFLTDIPLRYYLEFANSKAPRDDSRVKHLGQARGGIERAITKWLNDQSDLVIHAAVMASPSKKTVELLSHLVKTYPALLEIKSAEQLTPLMLAYKMGRVDFAKVLLEAGAEQTPKDGSWSNLLHLALQETPMAEQLKPMLELLDKDQVLRMMKERNSLEREGRTPLHQWIAKIAENRYYTLYKSDEAALEVLNLLLGLTSETTTRRVLRTTDGTGETPLHTLVSSDNSASAALAGRLLQFDAELLCRENAVGRTPAELARDRFVASKITAPQRTTWWPDNSVTTLVDKAASEFVDWKAKKSGTRSEGLDKASKMWSLCEDALGTLKLPKRSLVSLHEANDVAKRIGEQYLPDRYKFTVNQNVEGEKEKQSDEEEEEPKGPLAQAQSKRRSQRGNDDFVARNSNWGKWKEMEDEDKKYVSSDEED